MTTTEQQPTPALVSLAWPPITATVRADGTGELTVAGQATGYGAQPEGGPAAVRVAMLAQCAATAASLGRAVQVTVTEPDGTVVLEVQPDGAARTVATPRGRRPARGGAPAPEALPDVPGLREFRATRPQPRGGHATRGWQGRAHRLTGGLLSPAPGAAELAHRMAVRSVQRSLDGPRMVVVANPKGGAPKTTTTLALAATFGRYRGGWVLAWDNNESQGTLGLRAMANPQQTRTAVDLLADIDRFTAAAARAGDLDNYVRAQGDAHFDVLASSEDPHHRDAIGDDQFGQLRGVLERFYRLLLVDTGNSRAASNWRAAVDAADALVVPVSLDETSMDHAAAMLDDLRDAGRERLVAEAVTVLVHIDGEPGQAARARAHFEQVTRAVLDVPADPALAGGRPIVYDALSQASQNGWLAVAAAVAVGL